MNNGEIVKKWFQDCELALRVEVKQIVKVAVGLIVRLRLRDTQI